MSGGGMCIRCGGGAERQTGPAPEISHSTIRTFCREHSIHWIIVYGYLMNRVLLSQLSNVPSRTWRNMRNLFGTMKHVMMENSVPTYDQTCTGVITGTPLTPDEWSDMPLVMDADFWGYMPPVPSMEPDKEPRIFFEPNGTHSVLGYPLVSEKRNLSFTPSQYLYNVTNVITFMDEDRSNNACYMLSPLILWAIQFGDVAQVAKLIWSWMPPRGRYPLASRALKRENWLLLLEWLDILSYAEADVAWVIIRKFLSDIPVNAASRVAGVNPRAVAIAHTLYGYDVPEVEQQSIFPIEDQDEWWEGTLLQGRTIDSAKTLETMYFFGVMRYVRVQARGARVTNGNNYSHLQGSRQTIVEISPHGRRIPVFGEEPGETTEKHKAFYGALCAAEGFLSVHKWVEKFNTEKSPPSWVLSPTIPTYEVRPGIPLHSLLAVGTAGEQVIPFTRLVPLASAYCLCFGPRGDHGCVRPSYDPREHILELAVLQGEMLRHDAHFD